MTILRRTLVRIAHEIVEKNPGSERLALVGIHTRGAVLGRRLHALVGELTGSEVPFGDLDISFYRDDVNDRQPGAGPVVHASHLDFDLDGRTVVLVDDVLFTGRTVRAAIDALFDYGRPERVQLAVLVDRGHRELPIRPDYVGKNLPTSREERVYVRVEELDEVDEVTIADTVEARTMRDLLAIADLERSDIERITERAEGFAEVGRRDIKKVPTLRGRTIINLFYESSTRTSSSFELAAKRLSADVVTVKATGSSIDKGESLKDTIATLGAYGPEAIVIRSPHAGAAELVARWSEAAVINAGDGKHEHPTPGAARRLHAAAAARLAGGQADLDRRRRPAQPRRPLQRARLRRHGGRGDGLRPADPDPARVRGGARLPGRLRPRLVSARPTSSTPCACSESGWRESFVPSIREYVARYQIDSRRLSPRQLLMHPGPVNRGVELSPEVIDGPNSLIAEQVESGLVVRMAILYELLASGRPRSGGSRAGDAEQLPEPTPIKEPA